MNPQLLLASYAKKQLSDSGGRKVVDKMFDVSLNRRIVEWSGTDRPEFTDLGGVSKVCVEAERTNLAQRSQGFNFAIWQKVSDATVTSDAAIAPDGTQTAALADVSSEGAHIYQDLGALEGDYTFSFFAKAVSGSGTWAIRFNQSGETQSENVEINSERWTRISLAQTFDGSSNVLAYVADSRQGATLNQAYIWGAQVEQGPYPTLYIPTSGSTVTRLAPFSKIDRVDIADCFIALIDDFVFGDESLQRYAIVQTINREFGLFTRNNNRLQFHISNAGSGSILSPAPFPWQPVNTRKKWFFSIYVKGTEVQIGMGDPETGDLATVEAASEGLNTGSHDLYLSGPGVGPEDYSSHYYTAYKNLTGHPKMSVEELKDLMQSMT